MDQILESYFKDFRDKNGLSEQKESVAFENFASYCLLRRELRPPYEFELDDVCCGESAGIDGIAVLVNERFTQSAEAVDALDGMRLDAKFFFFQTKQSAKFDQGDMLKFFSAVERFFQQKSLVGVDENCERWHELKNRLYREAARFGTNPSIDLFYVTTGKWIGDEILLNELNAAKTRLESLSLFSKVDITPVDADSLKKIYQRFLVGITSQMTFEKHTIVPKIEGVKQAFVGILPVEAYLKLITDESGEITRTVFYDNVRDFQGENPVNREITETLVDDPLGGQRFVLLNNGVTIVAKSIRQTGTEFLINDFQVVNGCQTSYVLHKNRTQLQGHEYITLKLIETDDVDIANRITKATNRQTTVTLEAYASLQQFHKELEVFYASFPKESRLYYERRSGQFDQDRSIDRQLIVTVPLQIKSFVSIFLEEPHRIHYYYGQLLREYSEGKTKKLFAEDHSPYPYYLSSWLVANLFRVLHKAPHIPSVWRYHVVLLVRLLEGGFFSAGGLTNHKYSETYCKTLIAKLVTDKAKLVAIERSWNLIQSVLKSEKVVPYGATRAESFTTALVKEVQRQNGQKRDTASSGNEGGDDGTFVGQISAVVADQGFGYVKYGQQTFRFSFDQGFDESDVARRVRFRLKLGSENSEAVGLIRL